MSFCILAFAMHILLIHQYFLEDGEGGGARWNEMSRIWIQQGHQVTVLAGSVHYMAGKATGRRAPLFRSVTNRDGARVIRCYVSGNYNRGFGGRLQGYFSFTLSGIAGGLFCARDRYDVIVVTSPPLSVGLTAMVLSLLKRVPYVFEVRDLWPESAVDTGVLRSKWLIKLAYGFEANVYRYARLINVLTPAFRERLIQKKVPGEKIICVPNAADFAIARRVAADGWDRDRFREEHGLTGSFVVVYVGAHGIANHLLQILEAADLLRDTRVLFLLIGDGMEKQALVKEASRRQLSNVRFVDPVPREEVFRYILASDIGTSVLKKLDTFKTVYSNKTFDYFSCRKPVLLAIDGISRELVEAAGAGMYAEPENPSGYAAGVRYYLDHPEAVAAQGESGYNFALLNFDRESLAAQYIGEIGRQLT